MSEWTKTGLQMPPHEEFVLIAYDWHHGKLVDHAYYDRGDQRWRTADWAPLGPVTHWMPLPEPPT